MRPYYLLQVKKPSESKYPFDYLKLLGTVPLDLRSSPLEPSPVPPRAAAAVARARRVGLNPP
jgi:branched-chain amino acid transport system substrate-binding protein